MRQKHLKCIARYIHEKISRKMKFATIKVVRVNLRNTEINSSKFNSAHAFQCITHVHFWLSITGNNLFVIQSEA